TEGAFVRFTVKKSLVLGSMVSLMFAGGCGGGGGTTGDASKVTLTSTSTSTATATATSTTTATGTGTAITTAAAPASPEEEPFVKVRNIVAKEVSMKPELLTRQSRFVEDLKADDLAKVHIHLAFEEEFDRDIPDPDFDKFKTLGDAAKYMMTPSKTPP